MKIVRNVSVGFAITLIVVLASCSTEPQPLQYGTDVCHFCKMTLMDKKFGAELVTKKGKVYKFDDLNCFLNFYHSGFVEPADFTHQLVVDYSQPGKLIEATSAFYFKSKELRTPMASEVAAFSKKHSMDSIKKNMTGFYLVWGEVITQFK